MEGVIGIHVWRANFHLAGKINKTVEVLTIVTDRLNMAMKSRTMEWAVIACHIRKRSCTV